MEKLPESAGHFKEVADRINERVLLNHEFGKLQEIATIEGVTNIETLEIRKFPIINIIFQGTPITMVTTHMGVDNTLWVTDALLYHGARKFLKFGSFISLNSSIDRGDIFVPDNAIALPGPIEVYFDLEETHNRVPADRDLVKHVRKEARALEMKEPGGGTILTYPIIRVRTDHPEYTIQRWQDECFGLEMECAALFAVLSHFNLQEDQGNEAQGAAVLICNREGHCLKLYPSPSKTPTSKEVYRLAYTKAMTLSIKALIG